MFTLFQRSIREELDSLEAHDRCSSDWKEQPLTDPPEERHPLAQPLDLERTVELADRVLELVRRRLPQIDRRLLRDWNDILLVQAFARGHRCLRSVRDVAARG